MSRIFISYKRADKDKAFKIKDQIESVLGEKCWIDIDGIESDAVFATKIIGAINSCEVFLFMYSNAHNEITDYENDWTIRELNFAQDKKKRIVFVNIDGSVLTDWFKLFFGTKQQLDGQSDGSINHLCVDLESWLGDNKPKTVLQKKRIKTLLGIGRINKLYSKRIVLASTIGGVLVIALAFAILSSPKHIGFLSPNGLAYSLGFKKCVSQTDGFYVFETYGGKYTVRSEDDPEEVLMDTIYTDFTQSIDSVMWLKKPNTWICVYKGQIKCLSDYFDFKKIDKTQEFIFSKEVLFDDFSFNQDSIKKYKYKIVAESDFKKTSKPSEYEGFVIVSDIKIAKIEDYERNAEMNFKYGIVDSHYNVLYPPVLDKISKLSTSTFVGKYREKYGLVFFEGPRSKQKWSSYFSFDDELSFDDRGISMARMDGKCGVLSAHADTLITFDYDSIGRFRKNLISVQKDGKWGFMGNDYQWKIKNKYISVNDFNYGYAAVQETSESGYKYIDENGCDLPFLTADSNKTIQCWQEAEPFVRLRNSRLVAKVRKDKLYGLVTIESNCLIPYVECKYQDVEACWHAKGVVFYKDNGLYGILLDNKTIVSPTYSQCPTLFDGCYYNVKKEEHCGIIYISDKGEVHTSIPISFDDIFPPEDHYCVVVKKDKRGLYSFSPTGSTKVLDCKYDYISYQLSDMNGHPLYLVSNGNYQGVFDGRQWRLSYKKYNYVEVFDDYVEYVNYNDDNWEYHYVYW